MNIRLLVLDIDDTIAGKSNTVSEGVKQAIKLAKSQGIKVALATGRMYYSAKRFHDLIASDLPIVAYNGAWIQCPLTGVRHHHFPVASEIASQLFDYFQQPNWSNKLEIHCYIDDRLYVQEVTKKNRNLSKTFRSRTDFGGGLTIYFRSRNYQNFSDWRTEINWRLTIKFATNLSQRETLFDPIYSYLF